MAVFWRSSQIPELKDLPPEVRAELAEAALFSIPITCTNLAAAAVACLLPALSAFLLFLIQPWSVVLFLPLAVAGIDVFFLNLARPQLREQVEQHYYERSVQP
jgi:hypothetical protein